MPIAKTVPIGFKGDFSRAGLMKSLSNRSNETCKTRKSTTLKKVQIYAYFENFNC